MHENWFDGYKANPAKINEDGSLKPNLKVVPSHANYESAKEANIALRSLESQGWKGLWVAQNTKTSKFEVKQDIARPALEVMPAVHQMLNGDAAKLYVAMLEERFGNGQLLPSEEINVIALASQTHEIWMKLNDNDWSRNASNEHLFRRYIDLPASEQIKDLDSIKPILERTYPAVVKTSAWGEYYNKLVTEIKVEAVANLMHENWLEGYKANPAKKNDDVSLKPNPKVIPGYNTYDSEAEVLVAFHALEGKGWKGLSVGQNTKTSKYEVRQDIARPAAEVMTAVHKSLNGDAAKLYVEMLENKYKTGTALPQSEAEIAILSSEVHDIWMKLNDNSWSRNESNEHLFKPYSELPASEQIKDLDAIKPILERTFPAVLQTEAWSNYYSRLSTEATAPVSAKSQMNVPTTVAYQRPSYYSDGDGKITIGIGDDKGKHVIRFSNLYFSQSQLDVFQNVLAKETAKAETAEQVDENVEAVVQFFKAQMATMRGGDSEDKNQAAFDNLLARFP